MEYEFHLQDPTSRDTVYLFEAIVDALSGAEVCEGMFAFASRAGVDSLIGDPATQSFLRQSRMSLLVGLDAVTDRQALECLREREREHDRLSVRVFKNPTSALFHPKIARFSYPDGRRSVIVGSGNLTPGGLQQNFEAFSVMRTDAGESVGVSSWDRFLADQDTHIGGIDAEALELAARNVLRRRPRRGRQGPTKGPTVVEAEIDGRVVGGGTGRFLVARVPRAGDRWNQVHFNRPVIEDFFQIRHGTHERVYLRECRGESDFGEQEVRPCVYSDRNKNLKIEVASHAGEAYPDDGPPIALFQELQVRSFAYLLLMPGEPGYAELNRLTMDLPSVGKGLPRVLTRGDRVASAWPKCPLVEKPPTTQ